MLRVGKFRHSFAGMILLVFKRESYMVKGPPAALREDSGPWSGMY